MNTLNKAVDKVLLFFMAMSSLIVFTVTFLQVISRFLFRLPIPWSTDVIRLAFVYLVFLGSAYAVKGKEHLNIDVLLTSLNKKHREIVEIVINLSLLAFFVFIIVFGWKFTLTGMTQNAPYLKLPMAVYYFCVPLSAALMFFYLIQQFIGQIKGLKQQ